MLSTDDETLDPTQLSVASFSSCYIASCMKESSSVFMVQTNLRG